MEAFEGAGGALEAIEGTCGALEAIDGAFEGSIRGSVAYIWGF